MTPPRGKRQEWRPHPLQLGQNLGFTRRTRHPEDEGGEGAPQRHLQRGHHCRHHLKSVLGFHLEFTKHVVIESCLTSAPSSSSYVIQTSHGRQQPPPRPTDHADTQSGHWGLTPRPHSAPTPSPCCSTQHNYRLQPSLKAHEKTRTTLLAPSSQPGWIQFPVEKHLKIVGLPDGKVTIQNPRASLCAHGHISDT